MLPRGGYVITFGICLDDLDVRGEPASRVDALEQVVTEKAILIDAVGERGFKCGKIVNPLAGIGALAEHVLIDVGHRKRVRVDTARPGKYALKNGSLVSHRQGRRY